MFYCTVKETGTAAVTTSEIEFELLAMPQPVAKVPEAIAIPRQIRSHNCLARHFLLIGINGSRRMGSNVMAGSGTDASSVK